MSDITTIEIEEKNQEYLKGLQGNIGKYLSFLSTMARFHKYPVADLTSFAIEAPAMFTAVASKELWAKLFRCKVSKAAKGVTLIKDGRKTVYYDVSETESIDKKPIPVILKRQLNRLIRRLLKKFPLLKRQQMSKIIPLTTSRKWTKKTNTIEKQSKVEILHAEDSQSENISSEQTLEENSNLETPPEDVKTDLKTILAEDIVIICRNSFEKNVFRKNVIAILTLQQIEREKKPVTSEELQALKEYAGFGGIPKAFDKNDPNRNREAWLLHSIMTEKEWNEHVRTACNRA